jgi:hypothetical protein
MQLGPKLEQVSDQEFLDNQFIIVQNYEKELSQAEKL